ncbi:MAG: hypothetical protein ABJF88_16560 [Rhodothermales bacterium]
MTPFLATLTPLVPAPDVDLRPGGGMPELDGAAFATLLNGALLHSAAAEGAVAAEGEGDVPVGAALTQEVAAETEHAAEESESTETEEAEHSTQTADRASAAVSIPLAPTVATPLVSASETGEMAPPAMSPPSRPAPALPVPSADAPPSTPSASAATSGASEQTLAPPSSPDAPAEAPVRTTGSGEAVEPAASDLTAEGSSPPVDASMVDPAHPVKAASSPLPPTTFAPMPDATAPSLDAEAQPFESTPPTDLSEPASPLDSTALDPIAPDPTALPADSVEVAPEPVGDDASTEPTAPSADDAEPAAAQQQEGSFEGDGQSPQDQPTDERLLSVDRTATTPDQVEGDPSIPPMSEAADGPAASARAETPPSLQRTLPVAWLRAVLDQPLRGLPPGAAAQSLQIRLDDGEGTLTIETHRDNDRVSVSVAFSDGHLRSLASASADRIHAVLQEHFGASVDLSLTSDGSDDAPSDGRNDRGFSRSVPRADLAAPARTTASPSRARLSGGRHEWVG